MNAQRSEMALSTPSGLSTKNHFFSLKQTVTIAFVSATLSAFYPIQRHTAIFTQFFSLSVLIASVICRGVNCCFLSFHE